MKGSMFVQVSRTAIIKEGWVRAAGSKITQREVAGIKQKKGGSRGVVSNKVRRGG